MAGVFLQTIFDEVRQALEAGDTELAIGIAQHILQHAPAVIEGQRLLGEAYLNAAQFVPASEAFTTVLHSDPEHIAAYYGLGLAQRSLGRTTEAIRSLERALEIQPNLAELRTQLLQLYTETPNSAGQFRLSRSGLGRLYARGQMFPQAIDEFRAVLDNDPERDDVRVALAEALWRDGQEDACVEWCRLAVERNQGLFKPTLILGYLQLAAGQPEGEALWRRAAAQEPSLATAEALFEVLPPIQIDEPIIPTFDEGAWRAARAASTPTAPAVPDEVAPSDAVPMDAEAVASAQLPAPSTQQSDDDLLALLLGFDAEDNVTEQPAQDTTADATDVPAAPRRRFARMYPAIAMPIETTPQQTYGIEDPKGERADLATATSTLDDMLPGVDAQPFPMDEPGRRDDATAFGRVEPFRLEDWDTSVIDAIATPASSTPERATQPAPSATPANLFGDIKPFSVDDLDERSEGTNTSFSLRELGLVSDEERATTSSDASDQTSEQRTPLGLSDDDLAEWEAEVRTGEERTTIAFGDADLVVQEPVTPFSLADLGWTDEEVEQYNSEATVPTVNVPNADEDITPFSLADFEPSSVASDATEPSEDDADQSIHSAETQPFDVAAVLAEVEASEQGTTPKPEDTSPDDVLAAELDVPSETVIAERDDAPPPENPVLSRFYQQLVDNPDNHPLRLALARANMQQRSTDQAVEQYMQLIKRGALLEPVLEDLRDLLDTTEDRATLRRLHRLIGDVYMQQDRMDEALAEYSWT